MSIYNCACGSSIKNVRTGIINHNKTKKHTIWSQANICLSVEECTICQENITQPKTLSRCNHSFCTTCIDRWLANNRTCPCCRGYVRNEERPNYIGPPPTYRTGVITEMNFSRLTDIELDFLSRHFRSLVSVSI